MVGTIIKRYGEQHEWVDIMLIGDQHQHMESASKDERLRDGTVITARYDWLTDPAGRLICPAKTRAASHGNRGSADRRPQESARFSHATRGAMTGLR